MSVSLQHTLPVGTSMQRKQIIRGAHYSVQATEDVAIMGCV